MNKKNSIIITIILFLLLAIIGVLGYKLYQKNNQSVIASENLYNQALYEVVDYMENVKSYLAKSTITTSKTHGAETLTNLWREANLAQSYLSMLPVESQELENTEKFLNQVSDYSYSLSRKNINGEDLSDKDLKNLEKLHEYSIELSNVVNQIALDLNSGNIKWGDLTRKGVSGFAQQVSSEFDLAGSIEDNFHEYEGLIYDGAYSEHMTSTEKRGLTGSKISEDEATKRVKEFIGEDNIEEISKLGLSDKADIPVYSYMLKTKKEDSVSITISETGGHIVYMNSNRDVQVENLNSDEAKEKGKQFLESKGYKDMQETYYLKDNGIITINYAYSQNGTIMYPDLIKIKVALDDGEILGIETSGYLNNHTQRDISDAGISIEKAKEKLNKKLNIESEGMAVIPTEWKSEVLCYEFKGKINETEYLVYINAKTGEEQDILIIINTPNGTLTM